MKKLLYIIILSLFTLTCSKKEPTPPPDDDGDWGVSYSWNDASPAWSPDSSKIAYVHRDTLLSHGYKYELWVIDVNTLEKQMLSAFGGPPDWSPDGNWITFAFAYVFKIKPNGDSLTQLTDAPHYYSKWLPDGKRISFHDNYNGLHFINGDGTGDTLRIPVISMVDYDWSKNFQLSYTTQSLTNIYIADSNGGNVQQIYPETGHVYTADWSPSCGEFAFEGGEKVNVYTINIDGSNKKQLTTEGGKDPDWSPGGDKIVYCRHDPYIAPHEDDKNGYLWIMNADGSNKQQITFP